MKINTRFLKCFIDAAGGWFRLMGVGVAWQDTKRQPLSFSKRNGYQRHIMLGRWSVSVLRGM